MYAKIYYNTGWTATQVLSDISSILSGTINLASLSGSINASKSTVLTTWSVGGWSEVDNQATYRIMGAPIVGGGTKYAKLTVNSNNVELLLYDTWNISTHGGTNQAGQTAQFAFVGTAGSDMILHMHSSERHMAFSSHVVSTDTVMSLAGVYEHTRRSQWDTTANGYKPVVITGGLDSGNRFLQPTSSTFAPFFTCRLYAQDNTTLTGNNAPMFWQTALGSTAPKVGYTGGFNLDTVIGNNYRDADGFLKYVLVPFGASYPTDGTANFGGDISGYAQHFLYTGFTGKPYDLYTVDGIDYVAWPLVGYGSTKRMFIRKG